MDERLPRRRHANGVDALSELLARQRPVVGQRSLDRRDAALGCVDRDARLREPPGVCGEERRRRERV
jgi:hypothetical protein